MEVLAKLEDNAYSVEEPLKRQSSFQEMQPIGSGADAHREGEDVTGRLKISF